LKKMATVGGGGVGRPGGIGLIGIGSLEAALGVEEGEGKFGNLLAS
jgi:hypothetical protein